MSDLAHMEQAKLLAQQAATIALGEVAPQIAQLERAVARLNGAVPEPDDEMKSPVLKWVAGIVAGVIAFLITGALAWVASSVTEMKETLARMDERQKAQSEVLDSRFTDFDRRITRLERYHQSEGGGS
ncbi:hypothetical protein [Novosphingobium gossypii]|uniref:hypothetical protein n=1 Tax=Novosphingobium gossypii TaxID=1604774 RepID=UPI003D2000D3